MSTKPLNIFDVLRNIDNKNIDYYTSLSPEEKKAFVPFVLMQWLTCLQNVNDNPLQIVLLNEFVNDKIFSLGKHPELLYYLMCVTTPGHQQRYKWKKIASVGLKFPNALNVVKIAYGYSARLATQSLPLLSNGDVLELAQDIGTSVDDMKKLKLELKKRI